MNSVKPDRLRPGDTICIIAPGSPSLTPAHLDQGRTRLERLGYRVVTSPHINDRHLLFAGTEKVRAEDINNAFQDSSIQAIICAQGGCGTSQVLPYLDFPLIAKHPKIFVGYSDITALQTAMLKKAGLVTFYGPMVATDFGKRLTGYTANSLFARLTETEAVVELTNPPGKEILTLYPGTAKGRLTGGCLAIVAAGLGTDFEIDTKDKILFFEDIDEKPHRIDRYLTHLAMAGKLREARGIIFGTFHRCEYRPGDAYYRFGVTVSDMIRERIAPLKIPAVLGLQFGHVTNKLTLPVGGQAVLDATNGRVFVEPAVA
ncbi:S66 peptidase family protein [Syntrophorhabdus aromaticivorans]|uniref:LD-carboxypeptidase n=1 Tax=Syntrophorhabdus aromaticivorans TaxID=328301 RepID=A0A971M3P1_9BACT|nr:LD-carboxypeptidase [Syntrophorhabdus aromaticivorans]NLW35367.1 LD-carboxypeptidase [Syntrophorhabdus aromaticivorans]